MENKTQALSETREWFLPGPDDQPAGPYAAREVLREWAAGRIERDSLCWREGMPDWTPLQEVKEFTDSVRPIQADPPLHGPGTRRRLIWAGSAAGVVLAIAIAVLLLMNRASRSGSAGLLESTDPFVGTWEMAEARPLLGAGIAKSPVTITRSDKPKKQYAITWPPLNETYPADLRDNGLDWQNPILEGNQRFTRDGNRLKLEWRLYDDTVQVWYEPLKGGSPTGKPAQAPAANLARAPAGQAPQARPSRPAWKQLRTLNSPGQIASMALSVDGKQVAVGAASGIPYVIAWDVGTGRELYRVSGMGSRVATAFSPDGRVLATAECDSPSREVKIWNARTGATIATLPGLGASMTTLAFSPDSRLLAVGCQNLTTSLLECSSGRVIRKLANAEKGGLYSPEHAAAGLAFSPDGGQLAAANGNGQLRIWDVAGGTVRQTLNGTMALNDGLTCIAIDKSGRCAATGTRKGTLVVWDLSTGGARVRLAGHTPRAVSSVAFSPTGDLLASGGGDNTVRVWDVKGEREQVALSGHTDMVLGVAFTPDGRQLVSAGADHQLIIWEVAK